MRQQHQKSRSRGRGRKPQNPLSRNFESNGPDVKIRGNAGHIAEKYSTLARDALSNGDTIMAENYFQHAEHYNRIVAAAQAQRAEEQANARAVQIEADDQQVDENAEQAVNGTAADANGAEFTQSDETEEVKSKPQKSGRGRSPRATSNSPTQSVNPDSPDKPVNGAEPESDKSKVAMEAISDDAAKLPESITGGLIGEEG